MLSSGEISPRMGTETTAAQIYQSLERHYSFLPHVTQYSTVDMGIAESCHQIKINCTKHAYFTLFYLLKQLLNTTLEALQDLESADPKVIDMKIAVLAVQLKYDAETNASVCDDMDDGVSLYDEPSTPRNRFSYTHTTKRIKENENVALFFAGLERCYATLNYIEKLKKPIPVPSTRKSTKKNKILSIPSEIIYLRSYADILITSTEQMLQEIRKNIPEPMQPSTTKAPDAPQTHATTWNTPAVLLAFMNMLSQYKLLLLMCTLIIGYYCLYDLKIEEATLIESITLASLAIGFIFYYHEKYNQPSITINTHTINTHTIMTPLQQASSIATITHAYYTFQEITTCGEKGFIAAETALWDASLPQIKPYNEPIISR